MTFAAPAWLWALTLVPAIVLLDLWTLRRDRARLAVFASRPLWERLVSRPWSGWRAVRLGLIVLALAGLCLALARPQWGIVREKIEREGVDVVLVLDTSASMLTEDVPPNRFFLARQALSQLVSRLEGDRFALLAFEGEAYPLVPLTLDADAVGLFLETMEPGVVPAPGTSVGRGLERGLTLFTDKERRNKVMVLVSDGEDLEGQVDAAVAKARELAVVVHAVAVGTEQGQPVPDLDREGRRSGFKKASDGTVVVSRMNAATLERIASGTGGRVFGLTPADTSLSGLAATIEGIEQKTLAREFSYRKKERFQIPLAVGLAALALALALPPARPRFAWRRAAGGGRGGALLLVVLLMAGAARAENGGVVDELLLRPKRLSAQGRKAYGEGDHPGALKSYEAAAGTRPRDPRASFNVADALYKNGKYAEAEAIYRALGANVASGLAADARFNLGNALYQKQEFGPAVRAYRDALRIKPDDADARQNLELALRALQQEKQRQERQKQQGDKRPDSRPQQDQRPEPSGSPKPGQQQQPQTEQQREQERFEREAGMPKDRALQLLEALQQNEKDEQKRIWAARRKAKKGGRDW
jgi:Ca-activated chloride channel homolog